MRAQIVVTGQGIPILWFGVQDFDMAAKSNPAVTRPPILLFMIFFEKQNEYYQRPSRLICSKAFWPLCSHFLLYPWTAVFRLTLKHTFNDS